MVVSVLAMVVSQIRPLPPVAPPSESPHVVVVAMVWLVVLGMCVGSYFTNLSTDAGLHFRYETFVCFAMLGALFVLEWFRPPVQA